MRTWKIPCSLAVIMVALALGFASSAPASVLCGVNESPCAADNAVDKGETFSLSGSTTFEPGFSISMTCELGVTGKTTSTGGESEAVAASITSLSFSKCVWEGGLPCNTGTAQSLPYGATFEGVGGNGSLKLSHLAVQIRCGGIPLCTFEASEVELEVTGGTPATISVNNWPKSGGGCQPGSTWSATLASSMPPSLFIVGGTAPGPMTRLCKSGFFQPCPVAWRYPLGTTIEGTLEGNSVFEFLYEGKSREPACEDGSFAGETTISGKPLIGELSSLSFSSCGAGVCAVEAQSLPYKVEIEHTTGSNGTLASTSGGSGSPKVEVNCGKSFKCIYTATSVSLSYSAAKFATSQVLEKDASSEAECGASMIWKATYQLAKPAVLAITS